MSNTLTYSRLWRDPESLTHAEMRVIRSMADGASNRAIAERLGISENCVKYHLKNIFQKWGTASRGEVVFLALTLRLVSVGLPSVATGEPA
jgi:DNA-binding CsgD family transcriptional regulator